MNTLRILLACTIITSIIHLNAMENTVEYTSYSWADSETSESTYDASESYDSYELSEEYIPESTPDSFESQEPLIDTLYKQACLDSSDNSTAMHSPFHQTQLDDAVFSNDIEKVKRLFMNFGLENKKIALCHATRQNKIDIANFLLAGISAHINTQDHEGLTLLHHAVEKNDNTLVRLLLAQEKIQINKTDVARRTPLHYAVTIKKCTDVIKRLVFDDIAETAETNKYTDILHLLLAHPDILINPTDDYGLTPLHYATGNNHPDILNLLLARPDILINPTDDYGLTPLHYATGNNHPEAVQLLLKNQKIQINKTDTQGRTALQIAEKNHYTKIISLFYC